MTDLAATKAALQRSIAAIETARSHPSMTAAGDGRIGFGVSEIDACLGGGLVRNGLHELRCKASRDVACLYGLAFALLSRERPSAPILWLRDTSALIDGGRVFPDGMKSFGVAAGRLVHVRPIHLRDTLWAAGEAVRTAGLGAVILHVRGNPKALDLSVSRKLTMRAKESGVPLFLLRQEGVEEASSAATRWCVEPAISAPHDHFARSLGPMSLTLQLERNRNGETGRWKVAWNPQTRSLEHVEYGVASTHPRLPSAASAGRTDRADALGRIVALDRAS
ncbi:hypothetical protein [Fulvimarina sp. MAC8]|uniref:ImuA family protein n=1 Tax=Fulvimarina sp. MAC8 TaxID=3162874 RepID=UPI0032ED6127